MMLIYDDEQAWGKLSDSERQQVMARYRTFTQEIQSSGHAFTRSRGLPILG